METELEPVAPQESQAIVTIDSASFYPPDQFPDLESAVEGVSLTPKYFEFKTAGESIRAVFCGFSSMHSKNKDAQIPLAVLQTKEGFFVNAGANLVSQLQKLSPRTAVQITYNGTQKTGSGNNVKTFDVRLLTIGGEKPAPQKTTPPNATPENKNVNLRSEWAEVWQKAQKANVKLTPIAGDITDAQLRARIDAARKELEF